MGTTLSRNRHFTAFATGLAMALIVVAGGCRSQTGWHLSERAVPPTAAATDIECPDVCVDIAPEVLHSPAPQTAFSTGEVQYWPVKLEEALQTALSNSRAMREMGGRILSMPNRTASVYDAAIAETDPLHGPEAALSAFDAGFNTQLFWMHNDLDFDLGLLGGLGFGGQQDLGVFQAQIAKTAATGTQFWVKDTTLYAQNSVLLDVHGYGSKLSAGFRHPLLQGSGIEFNRIAGPNSRPGMYNGVLLGRINTDVTLADFEASVRDLLFDVEQTYWQLYRAYRDLDARITAREAALQTWQLIQRRLESGATDREQESHARQQYYLFDSQVVNAQTGMSTAANAAQGNPAGVPGVLTLERRLRWLMGLPAADGRLIRPADTPADVRVVFDWNESLQDALTRRVELRRQRWVIKRRELELIAARNFLRMRLDVTGQYGVYGMDADLFGNIAGLEPSLSGDGDQWQMGLQLSTPIGNRIGHTAVRNAQLQLARERAIYRDQELRAVHDLSDAVSNVDRSYAVARASFNSFIAAHQQLEEIRKKYDAGLVPLDFLLDAQRRVVEADSAYYQSTVDYAVSVTNVYVARGTLLAYDNVYLSEGPWTDEAYSSALRQSRRFAPRVLNYVYEAPAAISRGSYVQGVVCPPSQEPASATAVESGQTGPQQSRVEPPKPAQENPVQAVELRQPVTPQAPQPDLGLQQPSSLTPVTQTPTLQEPAIGPVQNPQLRQPSIGEGDAPIQRTTLLQPAPQASAPDGSGTRQPIEGLGLRQPIVSQIDAPILR